MGWRGVGGMSTWDERPGGEVVVYEAPDGEVRVDVWLARETVWLSLGQLEELFFGRDKSVISRHLRNVFASGELEREAVVAKNATTAADGKTYQVENFTSTPSSRCGSSRKRSSRDKPTGRFCGLYDIFHKWLDKPSIGNTIQP